MCTLDHYRQRHLDDGLLAAEREMRARHFALLHSDDSKTACKPQQPTPPRSARPQVSQPRVIRQPARGVALYQRKRVEQRDCPIRTPKDMGMHSNVHTTIRAAQARPSLHDSCQCPGECLRLIAVT